MILLGCLIQKSLDLHNIFLERHSTHCLRGPGLLKIGILFTGGVFDKEMLYCVGYLERQRQMCDILDSEQVSESGNHVISSQPIGIQDTHTNGVT
jgi:hypothetical protein